MISDTEASTANADVMSDRGASRAEHNVMSNGGVMSDRECVMELVVVVLVHVCVVVKWSYILKMLNDIVAFVSCK